MQGLNLVIPLNIMQGFIKFMASSKAATESLLKTLNNNNNNNGKDKGVVQIKEPEKVEKKTEMNFERVKAKIIMNNIAIRIPEKVTFLLK